MVLPRSGLAQKITLRTNVRYPYDHRALRRVTGSVIFRAKPDSRQRIYYSVLHTALKVEPAVISDLLYDRLLYILGYKGKWEMFCRC